MSQLPSGHGELSASSVFAGLTPTPKFDSEPAGQVRTARNLNSTVPILLIGSMAMSFAVTAHDAVLKPAQKPATTNAGGSASMQSAAAPLKVTVAVPSTYRVVAGDTISRIASRFGLATSLVLSLNGLKSTSLIFPGQVLKLTKAPTAATAVPVATTSSTSYKIAKGDTIGRVAARYGVSTAAVLGANGLKWSSIIYPGQVITIPAKGGVLNATPISSVTPIAPTPPVVPAPAPVVVAPPVVSAPPAVATPPAAPPVVLGSYVIVSGDTISKIAAKFGVTVQAVLDANGLTRTSIIYTGRTLLIPGLVVTPPPAPAAPGTTTLLTDEQSANALIIIAVGRGLGVSDFGIVVALSTAMQESSLRNINYGHLDSVGLFQQRPSSGWGTVAQLTDPVHSARLFYGGPSNPNKGKTRGLLDISGWAMMTVTQAAQKVQISAYPNAYAKWEASARVWLSALS